MDDSGGWSRILLQHHGNSSWLCQASILTGNREIKATWAFQLKKRTWSFAFDLVVGWGMGLGSYLGDKCHNRKKTMNLKFNCKIWCLKPGLAQIIVIFSFAGGNPYRIHQGVPLRSWDGTEWDGFCITYEAENMSFQKRRIIFQGWSALEDQSIDLTLTSRRGCDLRTMPD